MFDVLAALPAYALPLVGAALAGGLIGLEREWRGRAAGFRTHMLISTASAVVMQMAVRQGDWAFAPMTGTEIVADPTRMAHGVLTGIGLLCAGAIFRTGFSIHGLTTAASLWMTAAIGLAFGAGLYGMGWTATIGTVVILVALRLVSLRLPTWVQTDIAVCWAVGRPEAEAAVEAALLSHTHRLKADRIERVEEGRLRLRTWHAKLRGHEGLKALAAGLDAIPGLESYKLDPRGD